ncbi:hypothetical protein NXS99_04920 [Corynebacterium sp. HS2168-gen11]|nr:hypothetical protein [Corynebacterium sp. HS2168-gen11]
MIHNFAATLECEPAAFTGETNLVDASLDSLRMIVPGETRRTESFSGELHDLFALTSGDHWQEYCTVPKA